jgi:WS/DGAT C-terminal domain
MEKYFLLFKVIIILKANLKSSLVLHFQNLTAKFVYAFLPSSFAKYCLSLATKKQFIIFSSLPGPTEKIEIFGEGVSEFFFFVNGLQNMRIVLNLISYNEYVHLGVMCDKGIGVDAKEIVNAFEHSYFEEINGREPKKE